ncbi:hypothetical protein CHS0354_018607 [Potamilus streckersoni]|uniref:Ig-like domain-containing protein n=1 Tax=Potamilus streckersoni TaxID=2493646 RepID=A0AAE0TEW3_9BIVA|nr:hypothetical protein CHS0354_018607 [Potamilus streckersoni]
MDNKYNVSADGTELSIVPLQREDHVTLTCMAWQDARAVSENTILLKPIYGPENMLLSPRVSLVTVLKGLDLTPVNCSAECFPECIFQWTRSNDSFVVSRETVLKLTHVKLDDSGKYICTAINANTTELKATENFTLSVLDRDEITTQLSLVRFEDDVAIFNIGYSLVISKPRSLTLQYREVTTFNTTWITERDILLLENETVSVTVEVSVLKDQHMYSYRAYSTYEWGVSGYSSEIVIAVVAKGKYLIEF